MLWLIDTDILSGDHQTRVPETLRSLGHKCIEITDIKGNVDTVKINEEFFAYGSFQFIKQLKKRNLSPITFGVCENININNWIAEYPNEWFFNNEFTFTVWKDFVNRPRHYFHLYNTDKLFIRPNSGFKTFSGQVIHKSNIEVDIESIERFSSVNSNTFILLSPPLHIENEFRFYIVDRKIVTYSHYDAYDKNKHSIIEPNEKSFELVDKILKTDWQVDAGYTVDIAENHANSFLLEFNSLSCAGLYPMCDLSKLFNALVNYYEIENMS